MSSIRSSLPRVAVVLPRTPRQPSRSLHMTPPAVLTSTSRLERNPSFNTTRLSGDAGPRSLGGDSEQASMRPNGSGSIYNSVKVRHFNSSPTRNAAQDTSSIDFVFLPSMPSPPSAQEWMSVPFLPDNFAPIRDRSAIEAQDEAVIRPEISTVAHESTHVHAPSAMSEVTDNAAMHLDPYDLTSRVSQAAEAAAAKLNAVKVEKVIQEKGTVRELWGGFLDDILGGPKTRTT